MGRKIFKIVGKIITKAMGHVAACMSPIIPGLIAGGLIKLAILLLKYAGILVDGSTTTTILTIISDAPFYFLPILTAYSSALHFKVEPVYAIIVVSSMLLPNYINLMDSPEVIKFANITVYKTSFSYTVLPVILLVYVLSLVIKVVKKFLLKQISTLLLPFISILITSILGILLIGPSMAFISQYLLIFITYLQEHLPVLAWVLFDATLPLQIVTGMHWVFVTVLISQLGKFGIDSGFMMGFFALAMSLSAIALAIWIKTKDKKNKELSMGMFITSFFTGACEPAIYGICVPYRKALLVSMIAGGCVGLYQGFVSIHCYVYSFPAIFSVLMFQNSMDPFNFYKAMLAGGIAFGLSFLLMLILHKEGDVIVNEV